jgi:hypothetical protein
MKTYEGVEVQLHAILTSSLDKGEWSASRPSRFIPGKMGGWVHPRAGPEVVVKLMEACSLRKHESLLKISWIHLITSSRTLWRCGDGLFFEVPPLASNALLATLHPLLENALQTVYHFEISCPRSSVFMVEKPRNRMEQDLDCMADVLMGFHRSTFSKPKTKFNSDLATCGSWAFPTMKTELRRKKFRSDQRSAARFREEGGALQEVHRLPREVLRKRDRHRTSTKLRLVVIRWVHKLCKRPS